MYRPAAVRVAALGKFPSGSTMDNLALLKRTTPARELTDAQFGSQSIRQRARRSRSASLGIPEWTQHRCVDHPTHPGRA